MSHLMSLSGVKRTCPSALHVSASDPKRTEKVQPSHSRAGGRKPADQPESPDHSSATPKVSVVSSPIVTIEPIPEFLTNGCSRPLCGNSFQKAKLVPTIRPPPMIAIIRVFLSTRR